MKNSQSSVGEDLLGPADLKPIDYPRTRQTTVVVDDILATPDPLGPGRGDHPPLDAELSTVADTSPLLDSPGDNPLDIENIRRVGSGDDDGSRVLGLGGIDAVDGVDPSESGVAVASNGQVSGQSTAVEHGSEQRNAENPADPLHDGKTTGTSNNPMVGSASIDVDERLVIPRWLKVVGALFGVLIVAALAFTIFEPIQVLPRVRLGPGYSLITQDDSTFTSEDARGEVSLYAFAPTDCADKCEAMQTTMLEVRDRVAAEIDLGESEFRLVTIALDPVDDAEELAKAAERSGADGESWQWLGGDESEIRTIVGVGFHSYFETEDDGSITFDPGFVLVDGLGVVRGEYRSRNVADDSERIVHHVGVLADELRYANGATAVAYEAAHLFLCYP